MTREYQQIIESGNKVLLRKAVSIIPESADTINRVYESVVLKVYDAEALKLRLPVEYGETVTLPLDAVYEIVIKTDEGRFSGRGRIVERFRDTDGDVCVFRFTTALCQEARSYYISCECKLPVKFRESTSKEAGRGVITSISLDNAVMETPKYLDDDCDLSLVFILDGGKEIAMEARVSETIRLRAGDYESHIGLLSADLRQQKELSRWILKHLEDNIKIL